MHCSLQFSHGNHVKSLSKSCHRTLFGLNRIIKSQSSTPYTLIPKTPRPCQCLIQGASREVTAAFCCFGFRDYITVYVLVQDLGFRAAG